MEDFVTFKIAKKLKEKGFRELCLVYYTNDDTLYYNYSHKAGACYTDCYLSHNLMPKDSVSGKFVDAPTISQVLKWLRDDKKIAINIEFIPYTWQYKIIDMSFDRRFESCGRAIFSDYEEAAIAGIEYVLDNLI